MIRRVCMLVGMALLPLSTSYADGEVFDRVESLRKQGYSVGSITPIFSQLVSHNMPQGFVPAFEDVKNGYYIQEHVLKGESVENWTQMVTISGAKDLATNSNATPEKFVLAIAGGFNRSCPKSFSATSFGAQKIDSHDAFVAVVSCGESPATKGEKSETALIVSIKGERDFYNIQWATRGINSKIPLAIDKELWEKRLSNLMPIKLCNRVLGEAPPYQSCIDK